MAWYMMILVSGPLDLATVPDRAGTYVLWFSLDQALEISVGLIGLVALAPGALAYVGSAMGPGGLRARLKRHVGAPSRRHWHIDYLTTACRPSAFYCAPGIRRLECVWVQALQAAGAKVPVTGFGSSDCRRQCQSHLLRLPDGRTFEMFEDLLWTTVP